MLFSIDRKLKIPLPMSHGFYHLQYIIPLYFGFAVFYDIFTTVYAIVYDNAPLPWEPTLGNGIVDETDHPYYPEGSIYANDTFSWYNMATTAATQYENNVTTDNMFTTVTL